MTTKAPLPENAHRRATLIDQARQSGLADALMTEVQREVSRKKKARRNVRRTVVAVAAFALLGAWAIPFLRSTASIATRAAHRQTLALEDGTRADLNARTLLRTDFRYGRRHLDLLEGEAFFSVARDATRPFRVKTPAGVITVLGTRFNVRIIPGDAPTAEVILYEGSVQVEVSGTPVILAPSEQLTLGPAVRKSTLAPADLDAAIAWRDGNLVLDQLTVGEAAARFSRYHDRRIDVSSDAASVNMGGSCPLDDLPQFIESLKATRTLAVLGYPDGSFRVVSRR